MLESKLKSFGVVGDALGFDVLDGVLQQLLVPDVGLDQMVEAARNIHPGVELEGKPANRRRWVLSLWCLARSLAPSCVKHLGCVEKRSLDGLLLPVLLLLNSFRGHD